MTPSAAITASAARYDFGQSNSDSTRIPPVNPAGIFPWIAALFLGALVPALIFAIFSLNPMLLPAAFVVTFGYSLIFGLPPALVYRTMRWTRLSAAIAGGFLIGAVPSALLDFLTYPSSPAPGVRLLTLADWVEEILVLGGLGMLGATGAFVFWSVLRWYGSFEADQK